MVEARIHCWTAVKWGGSESDVHAKNQFVDGDLMVPVAVTDARLLYDNRAIGAGDGDGGGGWATCLG